MASRLQPCVSPVSCTCSCPELDAIHYWLEALPAEHRKCTFRRPPLAEQAVSECLQGPLPAAESEVELVAEEPPARRSKAPAHAVRRSGAVARGRRAAREASPEDEEEVVQVLQVGSALYWTTTLAGLDP